MNKHVKIWCGGIGIVFAIITGVSFTAILFCIILTLSENNYNPLLIKIMCISVPTCIISIFISHIAQCYSKLDDKDDV